ncbi:MAG: SDR family NAD(P)-dependent oxidoreductase [Chloroflexi bacterium]|nr:SDR family NAD(P)-dependent oxidoreductase [Chloroflexota bacterium]
MSELKDKVVLITGAGRGLGRELALTLAKEGAIVAANDLTPINVDEVVTEIIEGGAQAKIYVTDVSKKLAMQTMLSEVLADWKRIDILINHASVRPHDPILSMDEWDWRRTIDVIFTSTFSMTQSVGRVMKEQGNGVIVNIGPAPDETAQPQAAYRAAKAGVLAFSEASAEELAEYGIKVFGISGGQGAVEELFDILSAQGK